jgi:hypothetical protein
LVGDHGIADVFRRDIVEVAEIILVILDWRLLLLEGFVWFFLYLISSLDLIFIIGHH